MPSFEGVVGLEGKRLDCGLFVCLFCVYRVNKKILKLLCRLKAISSCLKSSIEPRGLYHQKRTLVNDRS